MATTRIMPIHVGKGRTESRAISDIIDYVVLLSQQKPDDTIEISAKSDRIKCF